jgi:hypothetical protein
MPDQDQQAQIQIQVPAFGKVNTSPEAGRAIAPVVKGVIATIMEVAEYMGTDDYDKAKPPRHYPAFHPVYAFVDPSTGNTHILPHYNFGFSTKFAKDNAKTVAYIAGIADLPVRQAEVRTWMRNAIDNDYTRLVGMKVLLSTEHKVNPQNGRASCIVSTVGAVPQVMLEMAKASNAPEPVIPADYKPYIEYLWLGGAIDLMEGNIPRRRTYEEMRVIYNQREAERKAREESEAYAQKVGITAQPERTTPAFTPSTQTPSFTPPAPGAVQAAAFERNQMSAPAAQQPTAIAPTASFVEVGGVQYPLNADGSITVDGVNYIQDQQGAWTPCPF